MLDLTLLISNLKSAKLRGLQFIKCFCALSLLIISSYQASAQSSNSTPPQTSATTTTESLEATPRTGSITGRVVGDDGRPIPNASVFLYAVGSTGLPRGANIDADGKFRVDELAPVAYVVQAYAPGYIPMPDPTVDPLSPHYSRIGDRVNVTLTKGGVITGTVTNMSGEPVVGVIVTAMRVRTPDDRSQFMDGARNFRPTDDRGVYRLYGMQSGTYLVSAGGRSSLFYYNLNAYDGDAPTYYPSSTRDTTAEVTVRAGEETTNIDIRYRAERGHAVSGTLMGAVDVAGNQNYGISISLVHAASSSFEANTYINPRENNRGFAFYGVADGEYVVTAQRPAINGENSATASRRITVKGNDVTGLELALVPTGSIAGRVVLEPVQGDGCTNRRAATLEELIITARSTERVQSSEIVRLFFSISTNAPNDKGDFTLRNLAAATYRLETQLPGDAWYVRSMTLPVNMARPEAGQAKASATTSATSNSTTSANTNATANAPTNATTNAALNTLTLKTSERLSGVRLNIAQDGASVRGRIVSNIEGQSLPPRLRIYLVPTERERADDLLRYAEANVASDGSFAINHLAPGRYWIITRTISDKDTNETTPRPLASSADERARLRREAESANQSIELKSCQRLKDYELRYPTTK